MRISATKRLFSVMLMLAFVFAVTGSNCARVDDRVTGPNDSETLGEFETVAACVQACNAEARDARRAERDLHRDNLRACQELKGQPKEDCMEAEAIRHDAVLEQIEMDMEECKSPCHEQGGGGGGQ